MKLIKFVLFSLSLFFSYYTYALNSGECTYSNQKLTYSGVNLPSSNDVYKDGEVLGQLILSTNYSCKTNSITNNSVVLQVGTRGAGNSHISAKRYNSNVAGIVLEAKFTVAQAASFSNEVIFKQFKKPQYSNNQNVSGTFNQPLFDVIKSGEISNATSVTLNLQNPFRLVSFIYNTATTGGVYFSPTNVPDTAPIPVYNASCSVTHPTNVQVPALVKGIRDEVSSYFNIVLNCVDKSVMQNNVQLTVTPVNMTNVTMTGDKTTLVFNDRNQMVLMNIFNSVNSTEAMMQFSTMYPFSNSSQGSSFTIPMRAKFQLGSSSGYGNFSFQTQVAVRYN
ncbi:hypothetical protein [Vibrio mediterranei]|uniref:Fimbrial protein n=1 Tax=Vibrio mediterranei TaxID=689 RepID=A0A3G4VET0_9VIBR|nr:hypothetical protein [Vibrio mediterranei]AYV23366.1 hypothetical protein ECB94_18895 [Vibrio mediterranei]